MLHLDSPAQLEKRVVLDIRETQVILDLIGSTEQQGNPAASGCLVFLGVQVLQGKPPKDNMEIKVFKVFQGNLGMKELQEHPAAQEYLDLMACLAARGLKEKRVLMERVNREGLGHQAFMATLVILEERVPLDHSVLSASPVSQEKGELKGSLGLQVQWDEKVPQGHMVMMVPLENLGHQVTQECLVQLANQDFQE
ncbi:hypothetical protein D4764_01G0007950 [Takifugu flavidus]|uniref:Uncharacterized protein n=1 Tax=Takifugu flavidus TaxID=433684 RepID=A0A5C6PRT4_9TELE|nr:hypothetical protein D4764_01G0007950 [Takifugu flavidus]